MHSPGRAGPRVRRLPGASPRPRVISVAGVCGATGGTARARRPEPGTREGLETGSVTAELAVAMPALVLLLAVALTAVSAVTTQMRCVDAAREAARAAARGDADAAGWGRRVGPPGATVTVSADAGHVRVVVIGRAAPIGSWLPAPEVRATALAAREPQEVP